MKVERILLPTDFSQNALEALEHAIFWAQKYGSTLYLLHVINKQIFYDSYLLSAFKASEIEDRIRESARKQLLDLIAQNMPKEVKTEMPVQFGVPFEQILRSVRKWKIDLIVMGTHGRTGLAGMFMGGVAEKVVRHATCPVLTVKSPTFKFKSIV